MEVTRMKTRTVYSGGLLVAVVAGLILYSCSGDDEDTQAEGKAHEWKDIRGIIHTHSIYSHDACDNNPDGNTECLIELREALCSTQQDYLMLTDHSDMFAEHEFPDVLLYLPAEGDELLIDEMGRPFANRIMCEGGSFVTIMAGTENDIMPVHLHQHPEGSAGDRKALYDRSDPGVVRPLHELGASVIVSHSEGWTPEELIDFAPDGIEIFNIHAAIDWDLRPLLGLGPFDFVCPLLAFLFDSAPPDPDLAIMTFWTDTQAWNQRWDALLAVQQCYGVAATDAHRNVLPFPLLSDGERIDSYRRMIQFFNNHLLAADTHPGSIEDALDAGRSYVAFEYLGIPSGFDFYATDHTTNYTMGDELRWEQGLTIHVQRPDVADLDPLAPQPEITLRLVCVDQGGSHEVARAESDIEYEVPGPGAYRAEVHIIPHHLRPSLGHVADLFIHTYPWIYANPIYVRAE